MNHASALFEALISTGRVMKLKSVVIANSTIPIRSISGLELRSTSPAISTHCIQFEAKLTTGASFDLMPSHAYAWACCRACPVSCAATAAAATLVPE